jgi:hypothetical protein
VNIQQNAPRDAIAEVVEKLSADYFYVPASHVQATS